MFLTVLGQLPPTLNLILTLTGGNCPDTVFDIFWTFKTKLQIIRAATYIALFLPDSNNYFLYV